MKRSGAICLSVLILFSAYEGTAQINITHYKGKGSYAPAPATISTQAALFYGYNATQVTALRQNMHEFMELIHKTPCINPPVGYEVKVFASVCANGSCSDRKAALSGFSGILIREWFTTKDKPRPEIMAEGPSIKVWFNDIDAMMKRGSYDADGFLEPEVEETIAGCPVYKGGYLVLTKSKKSLFSYVTREMVLKRQIKEEEAQVVSVKETNAKGSAYQYWLKNEPGMLKASREGLDYYAKKDPEGAKVKWEKIKADSEKRGRELKEKEAKELEDNRKFLQTIEDRLQKYKDELKAMSPAERNKTALDSKGRKIVVPNPGFWDPARKASDLQLVIIDLFHYKLRNSLSHDLIRELRKTIDIAALAASLK